MSDTRALRWGDQIPEGADEARELLLDAAERCLERWGPAKTTLADIAAEAGVSRTTVYRHLGGRNDLFIAMTMRRMNHGQRAVDEMHPDLPIGVRIVEMLLRGRDWVLGFDRPDLGHLLVSSPELVEASRKNYREWFERAAEVGGLRGNAELDAIVEWVLFMRAAVWSDTTSDRDALREMLVRFMAPSIPTST